MIPGQKKHQIILKMFIQKPDDALKGRKQVANL